MIYNIHDIQIFIIFMIQWLLGYVQSDAQCQEGIGPYTPVYGAATAGKKTVLADLAAHLG